MFNALDNNECKEYLLRAAHAGIAAAQYELGCFYFYGTYNPDSKTDYNLAEVWLRDVLNNSSADAQLIHCTKIILKELRKEQRKKMLPYLTPEPEKIQQDLLAKEQEEENSVKRKRLIGYAGEKVKEII